MTAETLAEYGAESVKASPPKTAMQVAQRRGIILIGFSAVIMLILMYSTSTLDVETSRRDGMYFFVLLMFGAVVLMFALMFRSVERQKFECMIDTNNIRSQNMQQMTTLNQQLSEKDVQNRLYSQKANTLTSGWTHARTSPPTR